MALIPDPYKLSQFPPELCCSVAEEAERDAARVCHFLTEVGLAPQAGETRRLPADFLLHLGAAMRLLSWEHAGFNVHLEAGLPSAQEATRQVFLMAVPETEVPAPSSFRLSETVFRLSVDCFAWTGRRHLNAAILLDTPDEDPLVEAMAQLLWKHRHTATIGNPRGLRS